MPFAFLCLCHLPFAFCVFAFASIVGKTAGYPEVALWSTEKVVWKRLPRERKYSKYIVCIVCIIYE